MNKDFDRLVSIGSLIAAVIVAVIVTFLAESWQYALIAAIATLMACMIAFSVTILAVIIMTAKRQLKQSRYDEEARHAND